MRNYFSEGPSLSRWGAWEQSPFNPDLDGRFPIKSLKIGERTKSKITEGSLSSDFWIEVFNAETLPFALTKITRQSALLIGKFVTDAVKAGQWVNISDYSSRGQLGRDFRTAIDIFCQERLAIRIEDKKDPNDFDFDISFKPTMALAEIVARRIGFDAI